MLHLMCYIEPIHIFYYIKTELNHNTLTVPFAKYKTVSFVSLMIKNIVAHSALFRFPVKSIFILPLDQHLVFAIYLNLLDLAYNFLLIMNSLQ